MSHTEEKTMMPPSIPWVPYTIILGFAACIFTFTLGIIFERMQNPHLYDFVYAGVDQKLWVMDYNLTREDCDALYEKYLGSKGYHCISAAYLEDAR
jgi:hypothetical protein